jgi:hypothetical protein
MATRNAQLRAEQRRLLAEYNREATAWSPAVRSLGDNAGKEFTVLLSMVDKARARTNLAKSAYAAHVAAHGC